MKTRQNTLQIESLEDRKMMAGDVKVTVTNGYDLNITGDAKANHVQVAQVSPGVVRISGVTSEGAATRINGRAWVEYSGRLDNVTVGLGGGNDQLDFGVHNGNVIKANKQVWIDMGAGSDWVTVRNVDIGADLIVNTGTGAGDVANVMHSTVRDDLVVGDPTNLVIASSDKNTVSINSVKVVDRVDVLFGNGQETVNLISTTADELYASLGGGADRFQMNYCWTRLYDFDGGSGSDTFFAPKYNGHRFASRGFEFVNNA